MLTVTVENKYGESLNLTNNADYALVQVGGLTPPTATINTGVLATKDGSVFNSSRLNDRNITLMIVPRRKIERTRVSLYKYIKSKQYIKIWIKNGLRDVWIDGYVESVEGDLFENPQKIQVSVICPDPYFKSRETIVTSFSKVTAGFTFPFSITNAGKAISTTELYTEKNIYNPSDDETGIIVELYAKTDKVLEPALYNQTTGEKFTIQYELTAGDKVILNTRRGEKSLIAIHNGVTTNIINNMVRDSKWFTLIAGDNIFSYSCAYGAENLQVTTTLQPIYEGV